MAAVEHVSVWLALHTDADWFGGQDVPVLPGATVTEDETWCPNISAEVIVPAEYAVDARTSPRARLEFHIYDPRDAFNTARTGVWHLLVRQCVVDYQAGTARLTLESPDVLLLGTAQQPTGAGVFDNLSSVLTQVYNLLDPNRARLGDFAISPDVTNAATRLPLIIDEYDMPRWLPPTTGVDYLSAVANIYRATFRTRRDGTVLAFREWPEAQQRHITDSRLLRIEQSTNAADFYNTAVVYRQTELGNEPLARREVMDSRLKAGTIGRRTWFQWAARADGARMQRALNLGRTWQVTTTLDPQWQPGDRVRVVSAAHGLDFTERVPVVRHTAEGQTILDLRPAEPGEDVVLP